MQGYASGQLPVVFRQEKASWRGSIGTREAGKFLLKILKTEVDAERLRVLQEKFPYLGDLRGRLRLRESKS
jgi:hypothetical protein